LVLNHQYHPEEIVTLTFTRKAAEELRQRIHQHLQQSSASPSVLTALKHAWLTNFHGCALRLLKEYDTQFLHTSPTILGENGTDYALFLNSFLEVCFGKYTKDFPCSLRKSLAKSFELSNILPTQLWQAFSALREDGSSIDDVLIPSMDVAKTQQDNHKHLLDFREAILAAGDELKGRALEKYQAFKHANVPKEDDPIELWRKHWEQVWSCLDRRGQLGKIYTSEQVEQIKQCVHQTVAAYWVAHDSFAFYRLCKVVWQHYTASKRHKNALDFVDLLERAKLILQQGICASPCRAILLDESQDTNALQREFIMLLREHARDNTSSWLFVVGDWKQSIYTFRGADTRIFGELSDWILHEGGEAITLSVSRRSTARMVHAINHLGRTMWPEHYEPLTPLDAQDNAQGLGMCWHVVDSAAPETAAQATVYCIQKLVKDYAAGDIAILLPQMTHSGLLAQTLQENHIPYDIVGGNGFYEQKAIVWIKALFDYLDNPQDNNAATRFLTSPIVGIDYATLIDIGRQATEKQENGFVQLACGTYTPSPWVSKTDRQRLAHFQTYWPQLRFKARYQTIVELFVECNRCFALKNYFMKSDPLGSAWKNVLYFVASPTLQNMTLSAWRQHHREAEEQERIVPLQSVGSAQAVTISSVHQSKGLEYPIVIMPYIYGTGRTTARQVLYDADYGVLIAPKRQQTLWRSQLFSEAMSSLEQRRQDELKRLLYVAVTRAVHSLIWIAPQTPSEKTGPTGSFAEWILPWLPEAVNANLVQIYPPKREVLDVLG
jgi:ATP-dependent exoDNAse (exonuclease V) beta subunit